MPETRVKVEYEFQVGGRFFLETDYSDSPEWPAGAVSRRRVTSRQDYVEVEGEEFKGAREVSKGPRTWRGHEHSAADIERLRSNDPDRYRIVAANMQSNGYTRVVETMHGQFFPVAPNDTVVPC